MDRFLNKKNKFMKKNKKEEEVHLFSSLEEREKKEKTFSFRGERFATDKEFWQRVLKDKVPMSKKSWQWFLYH